MGRLFGDWVVDDYAPNHVCYDPQLVDPASQTVKLPVWVCGKVGEDTYRTPVARHLVLNDVVVKDPEPNKLNIISVTKLEADNIRWHHPVTTAVEWISLQPPCRVYRDYNNPNKPATLLTTEYNHLYFAKVARPEEQDQNINWWKTQEQIDREQAEAEAEWQREEEFRQEKERLAEERRRMKQFVKFDSDDEDEEMNG